MTAMRASIAGIPVPDDTGTVRVGTAQVALAGVTGYRIEDKVEEAPRLGNIIMLNLFVGLALGTLVGILSDQLSFRFYLAVVLFSLLAAAALDDLVRSCGLPRQRLFVVRGEAETLTFVTPDLRAMQRADATLARCGVPKVA